MRYWHILKWLNDSHVRQWDHHVDDRSIKSNFSVPFRVAKQSRRSHVKKDQVNPFEEENCHHHRHWPFFPTPRSVVRVSQMYRDVSWSSMTFFDTKTNKKIARIVRRVMALLINIDSRNVSRHYQNDSNFLFRNYTRKWIDKQLWNILRDNKVSP